MTDRELLELAAKAAGWEWKRYSEEDGLLLYPNHKECYAWNPLRYDYTAFTLMVDLGMDVLFTEDVVEVVATQHPYKENHQVDYPWAWESLGNDASSATRRAIVRAAAEIGRRLK